MAENIPSRPHRNRPQPPVKAVEIPPAPAHLSDEASRMWTDICEEWALDAAALPILRGALEHWDQYQACRQIVAKQGQTVTTGNGMVRQHPAAKLALDSFSAFRQAMRQLGLEPAEG